MTDTSPGSIIQGGIIAAGQGARLRAEGYGVSKPMVPVAGRPLIERSLDRFRAVGIRRLSIIINETSHDCREWLRDHAGDFDLDLLIRTTPSSYASLLAVVGRLADGPAVITTIDAIMPVDDFQTFIRSAATLANDAVALALTHHLGDADPLWATLDATSSRIQELGGSCGTHVTAGLYWIPTQRPPFPAKSFARLRDYLAWLVNKGSAVRGIVLPRVFDIDTARDIAAAESAEFCHQLERCRA
jgi:NDP-sugar pyrophosphorylase family protein